MTSTARFKWWVNPLPPWEIFHAFLSSDFFQNQLFWNFFSGIPSEWQTDWNQIRPDIFVGPDLGPFCLQRLWANDTSRHCVKVSCSYKMQQSYWATVCLFCVVSRALRLKSTSADNFCSACQGSGILLWKESPFFKETKSATMTIFKKKNLFKSFVKAELS